jgi:hypothetical protein
MNYEDAFMFRPSLDGRQAAICAREPKVLPVTAFWPTFPMRAGGQLPPCRIARIEIRLLYNFVI